MVFLTFTLSANAFPTFTRPKPPVGTTQVDLNGIAQLPNCSGSIIRLTNNPEAKVIVLSNGHCIDLLKPGTYRSDDALNETIGLFGPQSQLVRARSTRVVYATMTATDISLIELNVTYKDLQKHNIASFLLSPQVAPPGTPIIMASGYFKTAVKCKVDALVYQLKEDAWTFMNSYKYSGCDARHGTSGSPLIAIQTGEIVGINNTGNDSGERCTMNNPCEVDKDGKVTVIQGMNYGQQTNVILSCVNPQGLFDLSVAGCVLPGSRRFGAYRLR